MNNSSEEHIYSGKAVYHLHSCKVRAWLFIRHLLQVNLRDPYIQSGDQHDARLTEGKRALPLQEYGKVDYSTGHQSELIIHDVTRSLTPDPAKLRQINYYLYAVHKLYGIPAKGALHTSDGRVHYIDLNIDDVTTDLLELDWLAASSKPPEPIRIPICKGCTNYDWCFS